MKLFKRILKYFSVFGIGFVVGFCVMYSMAYDVVKTTRDYIKADFDYRVHLGLYTPADQQLMKDSIDTLQGKLYKEAHDKYGEVTPLGECPYDGHAFYLFEYQP